MTYRAKPGHTTPYDSKTIAEIIHDYAVVRGDLTEQYARDQLTSLVEMRIADAGAAALREAADDAYARFMSGKTLGMPTDAWLRERADREAS